MKKTLGTTLLLLGILGATAAIAATPVMTVSGNPGYGTWVFDGTDPTPVEVIYQASFALGIGFSWMGDTSGYGEDMEGYRAGWDLVDPSNPNDPGWLGADFGPALFTAQRVFSSGVHTFTVVGRDTAGGTTTASFIIDVQNTVSVQGATWGQVKALFRQ